MRYPKALFLTPYAPKGYFGGVRPPAGIGYVEEYVRRHNVQTCSFDATLGDSLGKLFRVIERERPDILGFTLMTYQHRHTLDQMAEVKRRFPTLALVAGGAHVSALEGEVLRQGPALDFVIAGEGEIGMERLCAGAAPESIPGLFFRRGDAICTGAARARVPLDQLPFPRFDSYDLPRYVREIEIVTSRGCPFPCTFCAVSTITGKKIRYRTCDDVVDELEFWRRRGVRTFQFGDDNFLANRKRILAMTAAIRERGLDDLVFRCGQGIRADLVDDELLDAMWNAGFRHLGIGVESGSAKVLAAIRKGATVEDNDRAVRLSVAKGFAVTLMFVVGSPGETPEDVELSIRLALRYPVMKAFFFNLVPFPATPLFRWVEEHDAFLEPYDELINRADELKLRTTPFFETPEMRRADRVAAMVRTEKISKQIQVATLQRHLRKLGPVAGLAAGLGYSDLFERMFIRRRGLRRLLDRLIFLDEGQTEATA